MVNGSHHPARGYFPDGGVKAVRNEQVSQSVKGQPVGIIKTRRGILAVNKSHNACMAAGKSTHHTCGGYHPYSIVAGIGNV